VKRKSIEESTSDGLYIRFSMHTRVFNIVVDITNDIKILIMKNAKIMMSSYSDENISRYFSELRRKLAHFMKHKGIGKGYIAKTKRKKY
ncbi:hypothetical protein THOM_0782, partial [Trachipleistophora hominis]